MRSVRRILIAVKDLQSKQFPSITKATQLARAWGAEVELFHALDTPLYLDTTGTAIKGYRSLANDLKTRSLAQLEAIALRVRRHGVRVTSAAEWDFPIYEAIVRRARRTGADLIVAECHAGRRIAPLLLRLTDWELLRLSPVPVLLIKDAKPYRHPTILAAIDPTHARAKPTKLDDEILKAGGALQHALRGTLHAVHAYISVPVRAMPDSLVSGDLVVRLVKEAQSTAQKALDRALRKTDIPRTRRHLVGLDPQAAIPDVARKIRSGIVVMGAVSRTGLKRLLVGNTAERLLDDLPCDILVVKPQQFANRVPRAKRGVRWIAPRPLSPFGY